MITNKYFYLLIGIFFMGVGIVAKADTYSKFETTKYYSKNQEFHVEVTPDKKAILYKNKKREYSSSLLKKGILPH